MKESNSRFYFGNSQRGGGGGGGMRVKNVTMFHKCHLGDRIMHECMCVCVESFIQDFEHWDREELQRSVRHGWGI